VRRTPSLILVVLLCAACSSPAATGTPTILPTTPSATPAPTAMPTDAPSPTEAPSASPSQVAAAPLVIDWKAQDLKGIGVVDSINGIARAGDTAVLLASLTYVDENSPGARVWWSADGASWTLGQEFPAGTSIFTLTAGGPGFVVAGFDQSGAAVWTSTDGRSWQQQHDSSLDHGVIAQLIATDSGLVGFGWRSDSDAQALWTSEDGIEWLAATNETGVTVAKGLEAVGAYGGRAIAFVSEGETKPPAIWETTGRAEWTRTGALEDVASIGRVAGGDRGWVALDGAKAWTSADGVTWSKGVPGPDVESDAIVDDAGYVAVGFVGSLPGETCGDQRPFAGHTWTSADGKIWERMPVTNEFKSAFVSKLLVVDRTLAGYGQTIKGVDEGNGFPAAAWTDTLPPLTQPGDASDKASVPKTCGG
jgi:hypothetical protein